MATQKKSVPIGMDIPDKALFVFVVILAIVLSVVVYQTEQRFYRTYFTGRASVLNVQQTPSRGNVGSYVAPSGTAVDAYGNTR